MVGVTGDWIYSGAAILIDGTRLYEFTARVAIEAAEENGAVRVVLSTDQKDSRSVSEPAIARNQPDGSAILLYDYVADPSHEATASHDFFGMVRLRFAPDGLSAAGSYLNYNGRYTCGECSLRRV